MLPSLISWALVRARVSYTGILSVLHTPSLPLGSPPLFSGAHLLFSTPTFGKSGWLWMLSRAEHQRIREDAFRLLSCPLTFHSDSRLCFPHQSARMSTVAIDCLPCRKKRIWLLSDFLVSGLQCTVEPLSVVQEKVVPMTKPRSSRAFLACTPYAR